MTHGGLSMLGITIIRSSELNRLKKELAHAERVKKKAWEVQCALCSVIHEPGMRKIHQALNKGFTDYAQPGVTGEISGKILKSEISKAKAAK